VSRTVAGIRDHSVTAKWPHVGVVLPTREALRTSSPELLTSFALAAEERGFGSVWAGDSLLARPIFDPFTVLGAAAAVTRRVLLGTAVLLAPMRPPVLTAQAIASLDQLSRGRLIIGVGRGFDLPETRREFAAAGADFASRTRRMHDTIALWRTLWTNGRASIDTEYSHLDDEAVLPRVDQPGGPPVWLAGFGQNAFTDTGRLADGWLPYPPTPAEYRHGLTRVHEAAEAAGRVPTSITPALMVTINVGESTSSRRDLEAYVREFYGYPLEAVSLIQACRAGTASQILANLRAYWDAGARAFVLRLASLAEPERQLDAFAQDLLPQIERW
jgi:alkanesulfonate monooxygenase SsuD/methylene tetrahydromethanopterin reductase-like flavin-dependent oxidoreductase (luciferase family)